MTFTLLAAAFTAQCARGQCYTFRSDNAILAIDITNLPRPSVGSVGGTIYYTYQMQDAALDGNTATLTTFGASTSQLYFLQIQVTSDSSDMRSNLNILADFGGDYASDAQIGLEGNEGNDFQNGLPAILPSISQWSLGLFSFSSPFGSNLNIGVTAVTNSCAPAIGNPRTHPAVFSPSNGTWYVLDNDGSNSPIVQQWGAAGDTTVPADYDGDGIIDLAVWRPSNGTWYILPSSRPGTSVEFAWGASGDVPVPGDYDGDGKTDYAVWRPSTGTWYIVPSSHPGTSVEFNWGASGDTPVAGDYDGDGKTDYAVWRPSNGTWYIVPSRNLSTSLEFVWGASGDTPVPGDYDGDGKTDYAVWRPSNGAWYVVPSSNPLTSRVFDWGTEGDVPVAGDYDGDGKTDYAVWRPSNGTWYIVPSATPTSPMVFQCGISGDIPVNKAP